MILFFLCLDLIFNFICFLLNELQKSCTNKSQKSSWLNGRTSIKPLFQHEETSQGGQKLHARCARRGSVAQISFATEFNSIHRCAVGTTITSTFDSECNELLEWRD